MWDEGDRAVCRAEARLSQPPVAEIGAWSVEDRAARRADPPRRELLVEMLAPWSEADPAAHRAEPLVVRPAAEKEEAVGETGVLGVEVRAARRTEPPPKEVLPVVLEAQASPRTGSVVVVEASRPSEPHALVGVCQEDELGWESRGVGDPSFRFFFYVKMSRLLLLLRPRIWHSVEFCMIPTIMAAQMSVIVIFV